MKLYQALKLKNKLVGEIAQLQGIIQSKNSRNTTDESRFNLDEILAEWTVKKQQLIELKTAISYSNNSIQDKIFRLSELKSTIKFWNSVSSREGTEIDRWTKESNVFVAHFNEVVILEKKKQTEKEIEKLQEELDAYNHETDLPALSFSVSAE